MVQKSFFLNHQVISLHQKSITFGGIANESPNRSKVMERMEE